MSFLDDLVDLGSTAVGYLSGNSLGSNLARTALTGYALNQINKSINRGNANSQPDQGVRLQVDPSPDNKIPVVYGKTTLGGIISDAELVDNNKTMYFCLTICEQTGNLDLGSGDASEITFNKVYWNDEEVVFKSDGITVDYTVDTAGTQNTNYRDLVKIYCFSGNSNSPVVPDYYTGTGLLSADSIMPSWTTAHTMDDLIFAIVRVDYNKEKSVTNLGKVNFTVTNSMSLPGDCLYDMLTNTRYGAGIDPAEIYLS
jgi:hypothetical protein